MRSSSAGPDRPNQCGAFDQFIPRGGEKPAFRDGVNPMARPAHALETGRNGTRRSDLAGEIDGPDIDAEFQRCRGDDHAHQSIFQAILRRQTDLARQAAVVRGHHSFPQMAQPLFQVMRHPLSEPSRIHKHQGRSVGLDQGRRGGRTHRSKWHWWRRPRVRPSAPRRPDPYRGDDRHRSPAARGAGPRETPPRSRWAAGWRTDPIRCTQPPVRAAHALQRQSQMRSTLVGSDGMDFIHDDRAHRLQHRPTFLRRQQDKQRLGCGDENMRRTPEHLLPFGHGRVAGTHDDPQLGQQHAGRQGSLTDLGKRLLEIFLNVVAECFQRRDVETWVSSRRSQFTAC